MFGISAGHLLILAIILLLFGPRRLPELGNTLGRAIRNFKDALSGLEAEPLPAPPPSSTKEDPPSPPAR